MSLSNEITNEEGSNQVQKDDTKEMDIDTVFKQFGPISKYGIALCTLGFFILFSADYNIMLSFFTGHDPAWRCIKRNNSSLFCSLNENSTFSSDSVLFNKRCELGKDDWEYTTSKDYSFVTEFDLVCSKTSVSALISAIFHLGGIISAAFSGTFADKYGRKPAIIIPLMIILISSIFSSYSTDIWLLLILNVMRGMGHAGFRYTSVVYITEFIHPSCRSVAVNLMNLGGSSSFLMIDLFSYYLPSWRLLTRYATLPTIFIIIVLFIFPESPRWLLATKKQHLAEKNIMKIARFNNPTNEVDIRLKSTVIEVTKTYTYFDLVRHRKLFRLTASVLALWFVVPLLYYAIALQANFGGSIYKTYALSTMADIPATFLGTWLIEKLGRKKCNLGGLIISGILLGCLYFVPQSKSYSYALNITIVSFARLAICVTFIGLYIWTSELFPTVLRSQGLCLCGVSDRCGIFVIPFSMTMLQNYIHRGTFLIMSTLAIIAFLIGLTIPETKNKPLKESYEDFVHENCGKENYGLDINTNEF